ncbi:MAG: hypothetical protein JWO57_847 [Pseudonocardiales bacterium]|nr:hypothetical protein [Pseudonocardiales bacterium]
MVRLPAAARPLYPYLKPAYTRATGIASIFSRPLSRLRGGYLPSGIVATMERAATSTGGRCLVARPAEILERTPPLGVPAGHPAFETSRRESVPRVAVAELPGARVLGPHRAVITAAGDLLHEVSYYFGTTRPTEHPLFLHPFPPPPRQVAGRLGVLASRGDVNYYHFLMDVLPRLGVLEQCPGIEPPDRWFVPAQTRFQRELLDLVGISEPVRIDAGRVAHVRADCLVVPGLAASTVVNPPWVVRYLRSRLLDGTIKRGPGRAVYVTRGASANNRQVANEPELLGMLAGRGFAVIDAGQLSVADQIRSFAEASLIVAPHGAALANLIFASPGATVIELFPAGCVLPDYWKLATGVEGLEYRYLSGRGAGAARSRAQLLVSDITVDLVQLAAMLDGLEDRASASIS